MDLHVYRNSQDRWNDLRDAARRQGAVLALNAVTFNELVERCTPDVRVATAGQRLVLLNSIRAVNDAISLPAAPRYAYDALSELKASRVRAHELRAAGAGLLAALLEQYDQAIAASGMCDPQDRCMLAATRVKEGAVAWLQRFERVVLHALYDLTEVQFLLVRALIEKLPDGGTVVLFNTTANVKPTEFAEWTWQRFVRDESLAERTFPEFCSPSRRTRGVLEKLFVFEAHEALPRDETLRIVEAPGRYKEVEKIAGDIADLLTAGENPNDIAVVVRHIETYGEMLEDVFARYGIPFRFETGVPLLRVPSLKYFLSLLDLVVSERSRAALARVMASAYFTPRLSPEMDVERLLVDLGYIDRNHLSATALAMRKATPLVAGIRRFEEFLDELEHAVDTVPAFMARIPVPTLLTQRDQLAWRVFEEEMAAAADVFQPARDLQFTEFRKLASEVAGLCTVDRFTALNSAPGVPRVNIIHPHSLGFREYQWIFAPGFGDGEFPARSASNPLLPDRIIETINERVRPRRLLKTRDRSRREPLYLFMILDSAVRRVTLTYPSATLEGDPLFPSVYIGEIARHYVESPVELANPGPPRSDGEWRSKVAEEWQRGRLSETRARVLLGEDIVRRAQLESKGVIRARIGKGVLPVDRVWHPSELNSLSSCPFVFLARHRLNIRPAETPDFEVSTLEIGVLAHVILRDFHSQPVPASPDQARSRMNDIIARRLSAADVNGQGPYSVFDPSLWKIRRRQLVSALNRYVDFAVRDALDGFQTQAEYLDSPLPAAALGRILLAGRPDHVSVRHGGGRIDALRVDDFKYSAASSGIARQLKESFQIPIYAFLASRALGAGPEARIEGRYLLLRSPGSPVVSHAIDAAVFEETGQRIEALLEKVRDGRLEPDPADRQSCVDCDYRRLCRLYGG